MSIQGLPHVYEICIIRFINNKKMNCVYITEIVVEKQQKIMTYAIKSE